LRALKAKQQREKAEKEAQRKLAQKRALPTKEELRRSGVHKSHIKSPKEEDKKKEEDKPTLDGDTGLPMDFFDAASKHKFVTSATSTVIDDDQSQTGREIFKDRVLRDKGFMKGRAHVLGGGGIKAPKPVEEDHEFSAVSLCSGVLNLRMCLDLY